MRVIETLPAWAARQRSRRLERHADQKVVRWINHGGVGREELGKTDHAADLASHGNVVPFSGQRSTQHA
jgi:hypothetical protein